MNWFHEDPSHVLTQTLALPRSANVLDIMGIGPRIRNYLEQYHNIHNVGDLEDFVHTHGYPNILKHPTIFLITARLLKQF